jgi:hypothetical protein
MAQIDPQRLQRVWLHAHEEDSPGRAVFRPDSHPLPPSRGRFGYQFLPGGRVKKLGPGPTDRRSSQDGTWSMDPTGRITVRIPGQPDEVLEVESLEDDRLIVKK